MTRWDAEQRWWFVPGEVVATLEEGGRSIPVVFEYDDGTLWSFRLGEERGQVLWDHTALALVVTPKGFTTSSIARLREVLHTLGAPRAGWGLSQKEQTTLDRIALELYDSRVITGRKLRHSLNVPPEEFTSIKATLLPRYIIEEHGDKGDYYGLTLPGILRSNEKARAGQTIESTLLVLRTKFDADPDLVGFGTEDVVQRGGLDPSEGGFIDSVLHAAWLTLGGGGQGQGRSLRMNYGVPKDVEDLVRCGSLDEFMRLVRKSGHDRRVWPTAPMRIGDGQAPRVPATIVTDGNLETAMKYDVTLSFAGEDRAHAEALAERLRASGVKVFYDLYEQASLWGKDLYEHLHSVYSEQATHCVIFVSQHYAKKLWTTHERKAAQERAFKERGGEYILPIRLDETRLPGLSETIGYVSISEGIERIAEMLLVKLGKRAADVGGGAATALVASLDASAKPAPIDPGSRGESGDGWLAPIATLTSRAGGIVPALSWRLGLKRATPYEGTKAEAHDALTKAIVTYDLRNIGRTARFPRLLVLPEAAQRTLEGGALVWTHAYKTGVASEVGDEQLTLTADGAIYFQRDTLWDANAALDFGRLAEDVMMFLVFAGRFAAATGLTNVVTVSLGVRTPRAEDGTVAIFHATPVEPDQPSRAAKLRRTEVGGTTHLGIDTQERPEEIVATTKRLLDRVANEFELEPSAFGASGPNFLAVSAASLQRLEQVLGMALSDYRGMMKGLKGGPL